jgi:diamine N-acetyltransferase
MPTVPTPHIRPATPADIPGLIALQARIWEPTYRAILSPAQITYMFDRTYSPESLLSQMTEQGHTFLLVESEQAGLLGFASFGPAADEPETAKLHKIYVLPQTQGGGLGRALLTEVEVRVRALGGRVLRLNVNRHNRARDFYERYGFAVVREEDITIGPYWMNDFVMEKQLDSTAYLTRPRS